MLKNWFYDESTDDEFKNAKNTTMSALRKKRASRKYRRALAKTIGFTGLSMAAHVVSHNHQNKAIKHFNDYRKLTAKTGGRWYRNDTESEYEGEGEHRRKIHTKSAVRRRRAKNSKKWYKRAAVGALALGVGALAYQNRDAIGNKYNSTLTGINKYADDTATGINNYVDAKTNAVKTAYGDAATGINNYVDAAKESIGNKYDDLETTAEHLGDAMKRAKDYGASRTYKNTIGKAYRKTRSAAVDYLQQNNNIALHEANKSNINTRIAEHRDKQLGRSVALEEERKMKADEKTRREDLKSSYHMQNLDKILYN